MTDTQEDYDKRLIEILGEEKAKCVIGGRIKSEADKAAKEEAERVAEEKRVARLNETISIPCVCVQCKMQVGIKTGTRIDIVGLPYANWEDPSEIRTICTECKASNDFNRMVEALSIPNRYKHMSFDTYRSDGELTIIVDRLKALSGKSAWIVLMGKRGIGKTHLAVACLKESYKRGLKGRYLSAASFYPYFVRSGFKRDELWDSYIRPHSSLLLDDLGQGEAAKSDGDFDERVRQEIGMTVDFFYRHERQLIITTNIESIPEMMERYGSWAVDRIIECGELIKMPDLPSVRPSLRASIND